MTNEQQQKTELRKSIRAKTQTFDKQYLQESCDSIARALLSLSVWKNAKTVFIYISMGTEPCTHEIINAGLTCGKRIAAPRCLENGIMSCHAITSLKELKQGRFGIMEPGASFPVVAANEMDLVIAPCVAADTKGNRLGNGGGYYDRFLASIHCPVLCLCHSMLIHEELPVEDFDIPVDMVLNGTDIYYAASHI